MKEHQFDVTFHNGTARIRLANGNVIEVENEGNNIAWFDAVIEEIKWLIFK